MQSDAAWDKVRKGSNRLVDLYYFLVKIIVFSDK
jgi:hypothetical protein